MPRKRKRKVKRRAPRTIRGGSIFSWLKDKASSLWNRNKAMIQSKALSLANQAKDRAVNYLKTNRTISNFARSRLPTKFGLNEKLADVINRTTGMGRRTKKKKKARRSIRGRGFFGDLWSGVKSAASSALPIATSLIAKRLGAGKRKPRTTRTIRGRGSIIDGQIYI